MIITDLAIIKETFLNRVRRVKNILPKIRPRGTISCPGRFKEITRSSGVSPCLSELPTRALPANNVWDIVPLNLF